ncbi:BON domain-containing protein [Paraburkholderia sp. PGU19]|uniref:BON domain-containing protein n=1 Tax=Paraburkholderia sp. PGU19 TaxID=2735434 RepID=UPI0031F834EB
MQRIDTVSKQLTASFERERHVKFQMENHRITLAGRVATKADRRRAEQDGGCPDAIRGVVNRIQVRA